MEPAARPAEVLRFADCVLDAANARLTRDGRPVELPPKAFDLLCHLARHPGRLLGKDELLDAVWGRRFVSESVLKTAVNAIRSALGDDAREPRIVETVARRGYRFVAAADAAAPPAGPTAPTAPTAAPTAAPLPPPVAPAALDTPAPTWVGRDAALARLHEWLDGVRAGGRLLALVGGEAGIGKTMLVDRFCAALRGRDVWLAGGQCVDQPGGGEPFLPLLDALAGLARGPHAPAWTAALRELAPTWLARLPWLAAPAASAAPPEPERMLREFGALLDTMTAQRPLVLVLEDLHWSDHASVQLLGYLGRRRGPARWLVVASYRPTDAVLAEHPLMPLRQELRAQRRAAELLLDGFSEQDVDAYLAHRFAPAGLAGRAALARTLHAHTDGLPIFVAHLVDDWVAAGLLAPGADGRWTLAPAAWQAPAVPETVAGLVERRIARLPGEWRALLEAAALLGVEFAHDVLARMTAADPAALRARCDALAQRGEWLASAGMAERADGALAFRYAFRHVLYQRVFAARAEPAQRLQGHRAAAQALQALAPHAAELALQHEAAFAVAAAAGLRSTAIAADVRCWRLAAAREARALHALADALAHYARVLAFDPPPAEHARVLQERSELLRLSGLGPQALAEGEAALAAAQQAGDAALVRDCRVALAGLQVACDRAPDGLALAQAVLADPQADAAQRRAAWRASAAAHVHRGEHEQAAQARQAALALLAPEDEAARAALLADEAVGCYFRGRMAEGLDHAREAHALYERLGHAVEAARLQIRAAVLAQALGRAAEAQALLEQARERLRRAGDVDGQRSAILNLVKLHTDGGDAARALPLLEEGWALADGFETPVAESAFLQGFYYCRLLAGDLGAAFADAERLLAGARALQGLYARVGAAVLVSDLHLHLADLAGARALLDGALDEMAATGEQALRPRVTVRRAWLDVLEGDPAAALARLAAQRAAPTPLQAEDAATLDRVAALASLAAGDPAAALAATTGHDGAPTREAWAMLLALRLQAQCRLDGPAAADLDRAAAEVQDPRLPALEGLLLQRALAAALAAAGRADDARAAGRRHDLVRQRLADSLAGLPARRAAFEAQFPALHAAAGVSPGVA